MELYCSMYGFEKNYPDDDNTTHVINNIYTFNGEYYIKTENYGYRKAKWVNDNYIAYFNYCYNGKKRRYYPGLL